MWPSHMEEDEDSISVFSITDDENCDKEIGF